jgi:Tol biopolymer transport system component
MKTCGYIILGFSILVCVGACTFQDGNGESIAYLVGEPWQGGQIYLMDADGSNSRRLPTGLIDDGCPLWAPDGEKLLFVSANGTYSENRKLDLFVIQKDGSNLVQLTNGPGDVYSAAWSPDGNQIVFAAGQDRGHRPISLYIMDANGLNIRQLTSPEGNTSNIDPNWSPDGESILFSSNPSKIAREDNLNFTLFNLILGTNTVDQITFEEKPNYGQNLSSDWSPDGKYIVFYSEDIWTGRPGRMYLLESSTNSLEELLPSKAMHWDKWPKWSPDGQKIVFSSNRDNLNSDASNSDIYIVDVNGSNLLRITNSGDNNCPDWQP